MNKYVQNALIVVGVAAAALYIYNKVKKPETASFEKKTSILDDEQPVTMNPPIERVVINL
jgi:hypothetical protein